jgi:hypothetical protein
VSGKCGSSVPIRFVGGFCSRPDRPIPQQRPTERKLVRAGSDHRLLRFQSDHAGVAELSSEVMHRGVRRPPRFARDLLVPCQVPGRNSTQLVDRKPGQSTRAANMYFTTGSSIPPVGVGHDFVSRNGPHDCTRSVIPAPEIDRLKVGESRPIGRYRVSRVEEQRSPAHSEAPPKPARLAEDPGYVQRYRKTWYPRRGASRGAGNTLVPRRCSGDRK